MQAKNCRQNCLRFHVTVKEVTSLKHYLYNYVIIFYALHERTVYNVISLKGLSPLDNFG